MHLYQQFLLINGWNWLFLQANIIVSVVDKRFHNLLNLRNIFYPSYVVNLHYRPYHASTATRPMFRVVKCATILDEHV